MHPPKVSWPESSELPDWQIYKPKVEPTLGKTNDPPSCKASDLHLVVVVVYSVIINNKATERATGLQAPRSIASGTCNCCFMLIGRSLKLELARERAGMRPSSLASIRPTRDGADTNEISRSARVMGGPRSGRKQEVARCALLVVCEWLA